MSGHFWMTKYREWMGLVLNPLSLVINEYQVLKFNLMLKEVKFLK